MIKVEIQEHRYPETMCDIKENRTSYAYLHSLNYILSVLS